MAAATDGEVLDRLVVVFLKRMFWCIRTAKLGALWPIREIGDDGRRTAKLVGAGSSTYWNKMEYVTDGIKVNRRLSIRKETYNVIRDFMLEIDHVAVHMSRYLEHMLFPFFLPPFV